MSAYADDFERADSATLGANWTEYSAGWKIVSGAAVPDSTFTHVAQRVEETATGNHRSTVTFGSTVGGTFAGVLLRAGTLGSNLAGSGSFYTVLFYGASMTSVGVRRHETAADALSSVLGNGDTTALAPGDVLSAEALDVEGGVQITAKHNGVTIFTYLDATLPLIPGSQRKGGIYATGTTAPNLRVGAFTVEDVGVVAPPANVAPTANISGDQAVTVGQTVTVTGTGSDTDGTIAAYNWTLTTKPAGSTAVLSGAGASRTFTADLAGTYTTSLTVTDDDGATSTAVSSSVVASAAGLGPQVRVGGVYVQSPDPLVRVAGGYT